jgi:hypothetical protein
LVNNKGNSQQKILHSHPQGFAGVHEIIILLKKINEKIDGNKTAIDG